MKLSTATVAFTSPDSGGSRGWSGGVTAAPNTSLWPHYLQLRVPRPPKATSTATAPPGAGGGPGVAAAFLPYLLCRGQRVRVGQEEGPLCQAPGRVPRVTQRSVEPVGCSPNLASAVSFRIFSYCEERRPSGRGWSPAHQSPGLDPVVRTRGLHGGWELITHPPQSGALSGQWGPRVMGPWGAGACTHVKPVSQKVLQHLATQQPQLHRGLEREALYQPD